MESNPLPTPTPHLHPQGHLFGNVCQYFWFPQFSGGGIICRHLVGGGQGVTMHKTTLPTPPPLQQRIFWPKMSIVPRLRSLAVSHHSLIRNLPLFSTPCGKDGRFHGPSWSRFSLLFAIYSFFSETCDLLSRLYNFAHTNLSPCTGCPRPTIKVWLKCYLLYKALSEPESSKLQIILSLDVTGLYYSYVA